jgi:RimJ/RimL family protein N-acetyltransferase
MIIETDRLLLRPWRIDDAKTLYKYASNPNIGPIAGWPVHTSVENSLQIIKNVLSIENTYAIVLRGSNEPIGSIGIMVGEKSNFEIKDNEAEIGYWIAEPFWGNGYVPEAVRKLLEYGFVQLKLNNIWCGYFEGNIKSKRVQEKCGFIYQYTKKNVEWKLTNDIRTKHVTKLTKAQWLKIRKS